MLTQRQLFLAHVAQTSTAPLMLELDRAEGMYVYSPEGKAYMDLISGISVSNIGHCHPAVVQAVQQQASRYMHLMVYGEYVQTPQVQLAHKLASLLPPSLSSVYLVNSGTEATEGAMKLARRYTGRKKMVAMYNAYHGSTQGSLSLMSNSYFTDAYKPLLPNVQFIHYNIWDDLALIDEDTACVFVETIQGEAGYISPAEGYLQALEKRCRETGALLVVDEIQCGFGRTGTFFAFEQYGITPDILLLAKGLGGGMPIGAFISAPHIMSALADNPALGHITTFGGHPVSCAAAAANLDILSAGDLISQVPRKEALFRQLLVHPAIREVRGKGLMLAIALDNFAYVKQTIDRLLEKGFITDWFLHNDASLRLAPPLIITEEEITQACTAILECL